MLNQTSIYGKNLDQKIFHWEDYRFLYCSPIIGEKEITIWKKSAPIGNGHIGARISGSVGKERIYFNLINFWAGKPYNNLTPLAKDQLPAIRKAIASRNWEKATTIGTKYFVAEEAKPSLGTGWIDLTIEHGNSFSGYKRAFNLDKALVDTSYTVDNITYTKTALVSHPDKAMVLLITASKPGSLNLSVNITGHTPYIIQSGDKNELVMNGSAEKYNKGMRYQCRLKAVNSGGTVNIANKKIKVKNADRVLLILTGATSYNGPFKDPEIQGLDEKTAARQFMKKAAAKSWDSILETHVKDHRSLFRRFYLELGGRHHANVNARQSKYKDSQPHALIMQYGRYLLIAGSREDSPNPMTLQGMWSCTKTAPWQNAFHLNENTQKQYHFAEVTGLPEVQEPVFRFLKNLAIRGKEVATVNYGLNGWCTHHQSDIWAGAGLRGNKPKWTLWPFGGAFLNQILWKHYQFSMDKEFLKSYYPEIKGCALFAIDWLIKNKNGYLVASPSTSPENTFRIPKTMKEYSVTYATTCDMTLIRQSLKECYQAATELEIDKELCEEIQAVLLKLYPYPIGSEGQLLEWPEEFHPIKSDHRHASGLLGLWSGSEITMQHTPELFKAAKIALDYKGRKSCLPGTSIMWARAREGNTAVDLMRGEFFPQYWQPTKACGSIPEMLLQSHAGEIDILPALPDIWSKGRVHGIRARGGFTLTIEWKKGKATRVLIHSKHGNPIQIRCPGVKDIVTQENGINLKAKYLNNDVIRFKTQTGQTYKLNF